MRLPDWLRVRSTRRSGPRTVTVTLTADTREFVAAMDRVAEQTRELTYRMRLSRERAIGMAYVHRLLDDFREWVTPFDPVAEAEAYAETWSSPGGTTSVRFGWLGEDGDYAYALGHNVCEDDFAAALGLLGEDEWNFTVGYMVITPHPRDCELCPQGYCDGGWSARFYDSEIGTEPIPVTWWSA